MNFHDPILTDLNARVDAAGKAMLATAMAKPPPEDKVLADCGLLTDGSKATIRRYIMCGDTTGLFLYLEVLLDCALARGRAERRGYAPPSGDTIEVVPLAVLGPGGDFTREVKP